MYLKPGCSDIVDGVSKLINDLVTARTKFLPNMKATPILLSPCHLESQSQIQESWLSSLNALVVVIDQLSPFTR